MLRNIFKLYVGLTITIAGCKLQNASDGISKSEMLKIVTELDNQFCTGIREKDSTKLVGMYSDSAQYVQPGREILIGKTEIGKEWSSFLKLKENPIDLILNIKNVRGTREVIYETGEGYILLADSTKWRFNYVNVWRLQKDGSYKLEIDTYN